MTISAYATLEQLGVQRNTAPTLPGHYIERPRLNAILADLLNGMHSSACVWGAAGSGKTTLIASWARQLSASDKLVLWVEAKGNKRAAEEIRRAFKVGAETNDPAREVFVFIDDAHALSIGARTALAQTLESLPPRVRVVMAGRYQPFTSLAFLEAAGLLREVRTADLAFDANETSLLAAEHGVTLSAASVAALTERTGGWVTALALAMPWIKSSEEPELAIQKFGSNHRTVADYLLTEVLRGLSDDERQVLRAGAVREWVPLALVNAVSGRADAGEIMHALSRRNALITEEEDGYRFHPMLLSFIQAEARRHDSAAAASHHRAAAVWFATQHDGDAALEQAVASADADIIAVELDHFGLELAFAGRTAALAQSERRQPQATDSLSSLVIRLLSQAPYSLDTRQSAHLFALANHQARERDASPEWVFALHATNSFTLAPEAVVRDRLLRLSEPSAQELRARSLPLDLLAATAEGWCYGRLGEADRAAELYQQVAIASHSAKYHWLYLTATDLAVASLSAQGKWAQASALEDQLEQSALTVLNSVNSRAAAGAAILLASRSYQRCETMDLDLLEGVISADPLGFEHGMLVPARLLRELPALDCAETQRAAVELIERIIRETGQHYPRLVGAVCVRLASSRLTLDGQEMAREFVDFAQSVLGADSLEVQTARYLLNPPTRVGDSAEHALEKAIRAEARAWHSGAAISAWIVLAQTAHDMGRTAEADARITRALRLADRFNAPRPFLARNGEGAALVEARLGRFGPLEPVAERIVASAIEVYPRVDENRPLLEPLTAREREILMELPVHQSVAEIARRQTLSVNTVKTHLRNIYQKLSAAGRGDAVRIAIEHGLL